MTTGLKVRAVLPQPKYSCNIVKDRLYEAVLPYCGPIQSAYGPLWNVAMERAYETVVESGNFEWILSVDSDSVLTRRQLAKMESHLTDDMDALSAFQLHRRDDRAMFHSPRGVVSQDAPYEVGFTHFGATFIRVSRLAGMTRPWFRHPQCFEDDQGFWLNWIEQGGNIWTDPTVNIGHADDMVRTYRPDEDWAIATERVVDWSDGGES